MSKPQKSQRFVVQEHRTGGGIHWDLMVEHEDVLWTWRMDCPPAAIAEAPLTLVRIADHPLRFLTYEGPVQRQTGSVTIVDRGTVVFAEQTQNTLTVEFGGRHLDGRFSLKKTSVQNIWTLAVCS